MKQLTVKDLREAIKGLPSDTRVFLGDDEELNGVHQAWYAQTEDLLASDGKPYSHTSMINCCLSSYEQEQLSKENQVVLLIS